MNQFTIREIPLVHGSDHLSDHLSSICKKGLLPISRNIKDIDKIAGNGNCISLRIARINVNFGSGELLIVNPDITNKSGLRFYSNEIYGIGNDIGRYIHNKQFERPDRILQIDKLKQLISSISDNTNNVFEKLLYLPEFKSYLSSYILSKDEFYKIFEEKCRGNNISLEDFFKRTPLSDIWMINEDICIPDVIKPKYILGYWSGEKYSDFNRNVSSSTKDYVKKFISVLKQSYFKK
jgi:hypothetical protein